ncbi:jg14920 [Pararge aegeria aegeria]|uniref:Jg14920 protein n=1 Tax=Pararge aegeria aegeria TaxID=348720 RepID=A0A8S4QJV3_9NEOP|nr:jg14920 [Pararge aegeria aegeria]
MEKGKEMVGSRVYVGGLPFGVRERDLEKFFKGFGRIRDILIKNGYGFVEFEDYRDADDAVYELNGKELLGERVVVEPARGIDRSADRYRRDRHYERDRGRSRYEYGPPTRTEYRLVVENLSSRISWQVRALADWAATPSSITITQGLQTHALEEPDDVFEKTSESPQWRSDETILRRSHARLNDRTLCPQGGVSCPEPFPDVARVRCGLWRC